MSKKTIFIFLGIIAALILLIVVLGKTEVFGKKNKGKAVEIAQAKAITLIETVSATGKIQPETEIKISSEVSGEIIELAVKEGQNVKKGQLLVRINPDLIKSGLNRTVAGLSNSKAMLNQADATLKEAEANFYRNKTLFEKGVISKAEWDRAVASFESAKANKQAAYFSVQSAAATVKEANDNLRRTAIYAPVDGTISKLDAELGETVVGTQQMSGTEIMRIANLNNMEVEVDVNENDIVKVNVGDSTNIEVDAYLKKQFKGIVTSISNSASNATTADQVTNFKVKVRILKESYLDLIEGKPESYSPFRPGMTATVDIITKKKVNVIAIPISAVVMKADTTATTKIENIDDQEGEPNKQQPLDEKKLECVFIKKGNKAKIRIVKTGIQDDTNIEVVEGLKNGEEVIIGPYSLVSKELNSGDEVFIDEPDKVESEKQKKSKSE